MSSRQQLPGSGWLMFGRAVAVLAVLALGVPWALLAVSRHRFGGGGPLHGVPRPSSWDIERIRVALTDRLSDSTIADVLIRTCLLVVWAAVLVVLVTVLVELVHMVRHDGLALPEVRGLGWSQAVARVVAAGLLVVVPLMSSSARTSARSDASLASIVRPRDAPAVEIFGEITADASTPADEPSATRRVPMAGDTYVVQPGDSVFGIAERIVGAASAPAFADRLLDLNLGRRMPDGRRFENAAFLDVGWELVLPPLAPGESALAADGVGRVHVVERGETLWSIAADELDDPERWPEVFEANRGRSFDDGRRFDHPDVIQPGWDLIVPDGADADSSVEVRTGEGDAGAHGETPEKPADSATGSSSGESSGESSVPTDDAAFHEPAGVVPGEPATRTSLARPENVWDDSDPSAASAQPDPHGSEAARSAPRLLPPARAVMLAAGVIALVAVRRRDRLRRARPGERLATVGPDPAVERALHLVDSADRFLRIDVALRAAASTMLGSPARISAVLVADDGCLELRVTDEVEFGPPWEAATAPRCWQLPVSVPIGSMTADARRVNAPCPALVHLGRTDDERDLYVDLETLGSIEIGGPGDAADAIVRAVAASLAGSVLAELVTLVGLGVDDDAFFGRRSYIPVGDVPEAFRRATEATGDVGATGRSTFDLRTRGTGGDTWDPAVVLVGAAAGSVSPPSDRAGIAVVSASPVKSPDARLAPVDGVWELAPHGIRLVPVGITAPELSTLSDLVAASTAALVDDGQPIIDLAAHRGVDLSLDDDLTLSPSDDDAGAVQVDEIVGDAAVPVERPPIVVRLLGAVSVEATDGTVAAFDRSKSCELVAWLATHRDRSTRTAARTAMWELDVRDATFSNVVSEARRTLARLVEPDEGVEWIGRTMTESLPLHPAVRTDAEMLQTALDRSRGEPPGRAVEILRPAVDLVVGVPFEGTAYLWPDAEGLTSQLVLLATSAAAELAGHFLELGDTAGVLDATGRGLRVLPGHEALIALRMEAHARRGDRAGVRLEWEQYERAITSDPWSDGEPAAHLVDLRRTLLAS